MRTIPCLWLAASLTLSRLSIRAAEDRPVFEASWNSVEVGPKRDLCGDLSRAVRAQQLKMGFYYSFMEWDHPDTLWRSEETLAWLYNHVDNPEESTVNDRWGHGLRGQVGDYYTTEYGNLLLNIGPDADGTIPVIMQDRLIAIGEWLAVNGEAIYGTREGLLSDLPWGVTTTRGQTLYLHVFDWPADHTLEVPGLSTKVTRARLLHDPEGSALPLSENGSHVLSIDLSGYHPFAHASVIVLELDGPPPVAPPREENP